MKQCKLEISVVVLTGAAV